MGVVGVQDGQRSCRAEAGYEADEEKYREEKDGACPGERAQGSLQAVTSEKVIGSGLVMSGRPFFYSPEGTEAPRTSNRTVSMIRPLASTRLRV